MPNSSLKYILQSGKTIVKQGAIDIAITPDSGKLIDKLTFSDLPLGNYQLLVNISNQQGTILGENSIKIDVTKS